MQFAPGDVRGGLVQEPCGIHMQRQTTVPMLNVNCIRDPINTGDTLTRWPQLRLVNPKQHQLTHLNERCYRAPPARAVQHFQN